VEESSKYSYPVIHDPHDIGREEAPSVRVTNRDSLVEIHGSEGLLGIENVSDDDVRTCQGGTKINNIVWLIRAMSLPGFARGELASRIPRPVTKLMKGVSNNREQG